MALETGTYISDLVSTNPVEGDNVSTTNDHFWLLKSTIKATFPNVTGAVTGTQTELNILDGATLTTAELNYVDGVTSAIQTQLDAKAPLAGPTFTGAVNMTGATVTVPTVSAGDNDTSAASTAFVTTELKGAWDLILSQATGAGAAVDFIHGTGGVVIDSTYDVYMFELIAVKPATDQVDLYMRTTTNASSFGAGPSDYQYVSHHIIAGSSTSTSNDDTAAFILLTSGSSSVGQGGAEEGVYATVTAYAPSAANPFMATWQGVYRNGVTGTLVHVVGGGMTVAAANVDGVRFLWSSGNFASGTINLYGRRK